MLGRVGGGKGGMREVMRDARYRVREVLRCVRHMECGLVSSEQPTKDLTLNH